MKCPECHSETCNSKLVTVINTVTKEKVSGTEHFCSEKCKTQYLSHFKQDPKWVELP